MLENIGQSVVADSDFLQVIQEELNTIHTFCRDHHPHNMPPILKVFDSQQKIQVMPILEGEKFNRAVHRREILTKIGSAFYTQNGAENFPAIVMLISEAWMKSFSADALPDKMRAPSDYPDAVDAIVVQAVTLTKPSILTTQPQPRAGLAVLEIKQRRPYLIVDSLVEASIVPANRDTTDLLNYFFRGWFLQSQRDLN
jgi:hypothetical protein